MLPSDHPDFFRRPPPDGRSRESSIVLDGAGQFWHEGERVVHRGMQRAFSSWIARHPDDGRYVLSNGYDWSYIRVEDVPFFVSGVRGKLDGLVLLLSDGSEEELSPETLRIGAREALYCKVKGQRFDARFTPSAQASLVPYVAMTPQGTLGLQLGAAVYSIADAG